MEDKLMNRGLMITLIVIGALLVGGCLLVTGMVIGRASGAVANFFNPAQSAFPKGVQVSSPDNLFHSNFPGLGILRGLRSGVNPLQSLPRQGLPQNLPDVYQQGTPGDDPSGWTFDQRQGEISAFRRGLRDRLGLSQPRQPGAALLTIDQAQKAAGNFLAGLNNPDLQVGSVFIFEDHAAVFVIEKSTGIGAMELLVAPNTMAVFPEPGPSNRWNLKYRGLPRGTALPEVSAEMPVSPDEAVKLAQEYLDGSLPGAEAGSNPQPFYGFYTIVYMVDGKPAGMLSVNGFNRQVIEHAWHGNLVEVR
jgi:hypothetical protein